MRKRPIDRIQTRIDHLTNQAAALLAQEQDAAARIDTLKKTDPAGRIRATRHRRTVRRARAELDRLQADRRLLVEHELRRIMLALDKQSRRTRERLDDELERLAPIEQEWERLRGAFEALEQAVSAPAIEHLAGHWSGELEFPEFPVREREGYARPVPPHALLF
jgi:DNA repair exonuclease SbcCD ATPase subunit